MRASLRILAGFALLAVGTVVLIPLPEVGIPALFVGLRLLGQRYRWARAANDKLDQTVRAGRQRWARLPRPLRVTILTALAAGGVLLIYALVT